jgi:hypothetical protein
VGGFDGGADKPALIPILDLPQADPDDAACHLAIIALFHSVKMKTTVFS